EALAGREGGGGGGGAGGGRGAGGGARGGGGGGGGGGGDPRPSPTPRRETGSQTWSRRTRRCGSGSRRRGSGFTTSSPASRFSRSKRARPAATGACARRAVARRRAGALRVPAEGCREHQETRGQGDDRWRGVHGAVRSAARVDAGGRRLRGPGAEED